MLFNPRICTETRSNAGIAKVGGRAVVRSPKFWQWRIQSLLSYNTFVQKYLQQISEKIIEKKYIPSKNTIKNAIKKYCQKLPKAGNGLK